MIVVGLLLVLVEILVGLDDLALELELVLVVFVRVVFVLVVQY